MIEPPPWRRMGPTTDERTDVGEGEHEDREEPEQAERRCGERRPRSAGSKRPVPPEVAEDRQRDAAHQEQGGDGAQLSPLTRI
ncbi:hypothetical protein [Sphaerisporangium sp. NPDC051011]|uniref:hypothetical protein n=1 Tax=Sphaerisporangium sp. NPDC051011 TaxID=3155792 RepID=UPI00340B3C66